MIFQYVFVLFCFVSFLLLTGGKDFFHYRVKTADPLIDIQIWNELYTKYGIGVFGANAKQENLMRNIINV